MQKLVEALFYRGNTGSIWCYDAYSPGLWIFGVENALLIGFFGGIMNIIPYLGPIIGSLIALTLGITTTLASGAYNELLSVLIKIASVQVGC